MNARALMDVPESAAGRLLWASPLLQPVDMKFSRGRSLLTLDVPADVLVRAGARYALVDELDVKDALKSDELTEPAAEAVVLAEDDSTGVRVHEFFDGDFEVSVVRGVKFTLYLRRPCAKHPHPLHWWGIERRRSADGRWWETYLPHYVMNDFGDLVEVPKC